MRECEIPQPCLDGISPRDLEACKLAKDYEISNQRARDLNDLILSRKEWIHRRVETIHFTTDGYTRRNVSLDLDIPTFSRNSLRILPITILKKELNLKAFDVRSASDDALTVLTRGQGAKLAEAILHSALSTKNLRPGRLTAFTKRAEETINKKTRYRDYKTLDINPIDLLISDIVTFNTRSWESHHLKLSSDDLIELYARILEFYEHAQLTTPPKKKLAGYESLSTYSSLLLAIELIEGYLMFVEIPQSPPSETRTVLKFSYDEPLQYVAKWKSWSTRLSRITTPVILDWSYSFHFEVRAPKSLLVDYLALVTRGKGGRLELAEVSPSDDESDSHYVDYSGQRIAHISANSKEILTKNQKQYQVQYALGAERGGLPARTLLWTLATATILILRAVSDLPQPIKQSIRVHITPLATHIFTWVPNQDGIALPVMLLASLAVFFGGAPEHDVVSTTLTLPRRLTIWCAAELYSSALNATGLLPSNMSSWVSLTLLVSFVPVPFYLAIWRARSVTNPNKRY